MLRVLHLDSIEIGRAGNRRLSVERVATTEAQREHIRSSRATVVDCVMADSLHNARSERAVRKTDQNGLVAEVYNLEM